MRQTILYPVRRNVLGTRVNHFRAASLTFLSKSHTRGELLEIDLADSLQQVFKISNTTLV